MLPEGRKNRWRWIVLIIAVLVAAILYFLWYIGGQVGTENVGESVGSDETAAIKSDLGTLDLGGLDAEVGDIDKELQSF